MMPAWCRNKQRICGMNPALSAQPGRRSGGSSNNKGWEVDIMKIGIFDSGVGGLTVLYQALKLLPQEDYMYYADTLHVPYGEKTKEEVQRYVFGAVDLFAANNAKAVVLACNAATSAAAKELRREYKFPIVGIEPAVKPAVEKSHRRGKRVLVLSTNLTLREEKYNNLVAQLDDDHIVDGLPMPGLVQFAERFEFDPDVVMPYLKERLAPYEPSRYGTVVLGCTHFPFYRDMLQTLFGEADIIDGSVGTARNLQRILADNRQLNGGSGKIDYYISGTLVQDKETIAQYERLLKRLAEIGA